MLGDAENTDWVRWYPAVAHDPRNESLREAVESFQPLPNDAGRACAKWLVEQSLKDWPNTATWVLYTPGRVHGFFALRSSEIEVTLANGNEITLPCSQIEWLAKRQGGKFLGMSLIGAAAARAMEVSRIQGNVALIIKPFDRGASQILRENHAYLRETEHPPGADYGHLWLPLFTS